MPRYKKATQGKLVVQDWDIVSGYPETPRLYILTEQQANALLGLSTFLPWLTRWENPPGIDILDAFASETMFNLMNPITCEMLTECLQPLFDEINEKLDTMQAQQTAIEAVVEAVQETQVENAAAAPEPQTSIVLDEICGGATALVMEMHRVNMLEYANAEASGVDNVFEFANLIIDNIPLFGELPFTALYDLANAFFENEATTYKTDFELIKDDIICDLKCAIEANSGTMTIDIWNEWLIHVGATYSPNKAAILFNRYAPAHQTFVNQIAALINSDASLQSYFDGLMLQYFAGLQNPLTCAGCDCTWEEITDTSTGDNVDKWTIFRGSLNPGLYFEEQLETFYPPGNTYRVLVLTRTVPATCVLNYIKIEGVYTTGTLDTTGDSSFSFQWGSFNVDEIIPDTPVMPIELTGLNETGGDVAIGLIPGVVAFSPADPGGVARITKITMQGTGIAP